jgi:hypothetical protein
MTFVQSRRCGPGSVTADGGTCDPRAFAGSLSQKDVVLSVQLQFKKGAPWAV